MTARLIIKSCIILVDYLYHARASPIKNFNNVTHRRSSIIMKKFNCQNFSFLLIVLYLTNYRYFLRMIQEDLQCVICWEYPENPEVTACCGQLLCLICLNMHLRTNRQCPYCRAPLRTTSNKCITRITKKTHTERVLKYER